MSSISRREAVKLCGAAMLAAATPGWASWVEEEARLSNAREALDHLMVGSADLDAGVAWFDKLTGVRPVFGGNHPGRGTRNALVSLGGRHYLEIIAPDPAQASVRAPLVERLRGLASPRPIEWAAATADIAAVKSKALAAGIKSEGPTPGSRQRPDGRLLKWSTLNLEDPTQLLPFFIQWESSSPHPSEDSPKGCKLAELRFESPDAAEATRLLQKLGLRADVAQGAQPRILAVLTTPRGRVELGRE